MKYIILDQNVISNLAIHKKGDWPEILRLLKQGVSSKKLLCPTPPESITESIPLTRQERKEIHTCQYELSDGYAIKFIFEIIASELLATVRSNVDTSPLRKYEALEADNEEDNQNMAKAINAEKSALEKERNDHRETPEFELTHELAYFISSEAWVIDMKNEIKQMRNGTKAAGDYIIQKAVEILGELGITDSEINRLETQADAWFTIPVIAYLTGIEAIRYYEQTKAARRFKGNDIWDTVRAATAAQFADCFITDKSMAALLKSYWHPTLTVFDITETQEIINFLNALLAEQGN